MALFIGIGGMILLLVGFATKFNVLFVVGPSLLFLSARLGGSRFLQALQVVVILGGVIGMTAAPWWITAVVLSGAVSIAIWWLGRRELAQNMIGAAGLLVLAIGFAVHNQALSFIASILIGVHATIEFKRGVKVAAIWIVLNTVACAIILATS